MLICILFSSDYRYDTSARKKPINQYSPSKLPSFEVIPPNFRSERRLVFPNFYMGLKSFKNTILDHQSPCALPRTYITTGKMDAHRNYEEVMLLPSVFAKLRLSTSLLSILLDCVSLLIFALICIDENFRNILKDFFLNISYILELRSDSSSSSTLSVDSSSKYFRTGRFIY